MKNLRTNHFTLLELAAVIAILILLTAISTVYIGRERKQSAFEQSLREFKVFCAKARARCMSDGAVRKLVYYPEEKIFRIEKVEHWNESPAVVLAEEVEAGNMPYVVLDAIDPDWEAEQRSYDDNAPDPSELEETPAEWAFPEKLGVLFEVPEFEGTEIPDESLEMWRFTRSGRARTLHKMVVQLNDDVRTIQASDFTGLVEIKSGRDEEGRIVW